MVDCNLHSFLSEPTRNLPATKELLLQEAWLQKNHHENDVKSVLYQTLALGYGFKEKYEVPEDPFDLAKMRWINEPSLIQCDDIYNKFRNKILDLPSQWTVVQLCKQYSSVNPIGLHRQILETNGSIYLSLLRYPRWELNDREPILVKIEVCEENFLNQFSQYDSLLSSKLKVAGDPDTPAARKIYWNNIQELESKLSNMLSILANWMGPYSYLLTGNPKNPGAYEAEIHKKVDETCKRLGLSVRQQILLSMLSIDLFANPRPEKQMYLACSKIATSQDEIEEMFQFLVALTDSAEDRDVDAYPCLLIVDERLDMVPWEMVNVDQETCRFSSLEVLHELFVNYKHDIVDGYLNVQTNSGSVMLNPDGTLKEMETRMLRFFKYYYPSWSCVAGAQPTTEECEELVKSDIYVYCGHGNGLQFFRKVNLKKLKIKAVSFLVGCASTKLTSKGNNSLMEGSHLRFHAATCPTVVGVLWLITDFYADLMCTSILSNLLSRQGSAQRWELADKKKWRNGEMVFKDPPEGNESPMPEPNLLKVMAALRTQNIVSIRIRAAFVVRGLPVMINS